MRIVGRRIVGESEESGRGSSQNRSDGESVSKREVFEGEPTDEESDETTDDSERKAEDREGRKKEKGGDGEEKGRRRRCQLVVFDPVFARIEVGE